MKPTKRQMQIVENFIKKETKRLMKEEIDVKYKNQLLPIYKLISNTCLHAKTELENGSYDAEIHNSFIDDIIERCERLKSINI